MKEKAKLEEEKKDEEKEDPKGIPEFWLTVFKNVDLLSDMLQVGSSTQLKIGHGLYGLKVKQQGVLPPGGHVDADAQLLLSSLRNTMNPFLSI